MKPADMNLQAHSNGDASHATQPLRRPRLLSGRSRRVAGWVSLSAALLLSSEHLAEMSAQQYYPSPGCVATIQNRSSLVDAYGGYAVPNVPQDPGTYRVHMVCPQPDGTLLGSLSAPQTPAAATEFDLPLLPLTPLTAQPNSLTLSVLTGVLSSIGATVQLAATAYLPDGTPREATPGTTGTTYTSSNASVATVDANGIVTARGSGNVVITSRNDGLVATLVLSSFGLLDSDGDGIPDVWEIANGLNPNDPTDAALDPDNDGLTNLQEFQYGTNPHVADTDGDGLSDGQEVALGTNPLVADTDGDGLSDGDEVRLGTDPLNPDTDGDGIPDGVEVKLGLNPLVPDVTTTVTGHVSQANGTPYPGAAVVVLTYFNAATDSTGTFTLLHVPVSLGNLVATAQVASGTTILTGSSQPTAPVGTGTTNVGTIVLGQASGQVSGYVTNSDNKPVVGAQVTLTDGSDTRSSTTDSTGLYVASGLQPGAVAVTVFDPATSLRGQTSGMLTSAGPLMLNVRLAAFGTISGTVRTVTGTPVGAGVTVAIVGALTSSTTTDALGRYSFSFVPLGGFTLDATDSAGDHGRSAGLVTVTAQTLTVDVTYLGMGTVTGVVSDGTGTAVPGAMVMLSNNGQLSQRLSATTNSLGQYTFTGVFVGALDLSAFSVATSTSGYTSASLNSNGQTVTANINLQPAGILTGTVFRVDGTTVVPGAVITLSNSALTATANASGVYTLPNIPLGTYSVTATDNSSGDRGTTSAKLTTAGQTVTQNVTLQGLGTLTVSVVNGNGSAPDPGALVTVTTGGGFYLQQSGVAGSDGNITFNQELAGPVTVNASDPTTQLSGTASTTVVQGATATVTVMLQSAGQIQGTVYRSDAVTPIPGVTVKLDGTSSQTTDASGHYLFNPVASGNHSVAAYDAAGNLLAVADTVTVSTQGQVVTANLVSIALSTVSGHVSFVADGTPAIGVGVQLNSGNANDNLPYYATTDASGFYSIPSVPLGLFVISAQQHTTTTSSYGYNSGTVTGDGGTVTVNIQLTTALIPTQTTLSDANAETYTIRENGALINGVFSVFEGDQGSNQGGELLSIVPSSGVAIPFAGAEFATASLSGQQLSIEQDGINGLNVVRRVYVPNNGYFARYLELLTNPTAQDITVGVMFTTNFRNVDTITQLVGYQNNDIQPAHILLTSSGDNILNIADPTTPDNWVTFGGPIDSDPWITHIRGGLTDLNRPLPPIAEVFDGAGAALQPNSAGFLTGSSGLYSALNYTYGSVTVKAGATVGLLHFLAEQNNYAGANASAARLEQLPAETLTGLSASDLSSVQNFIIPAGGGNPNVAALPTLTSQVTGVVYGSDGITPVPGAGVSFQSTDPIFGRVYSTGAANDGSFNFQGSFPGEAIANENYTLSATHPITGIVSPAFPGTFPSGSTASGQNILFNNSGTITGTVSRGPTVVTAAGTLTFTGGSFASPLVIPINGDGTYTLTGVPIGTYTILAQVTNTLLTGVTTAVVTVGQTTTANITIGGSGNVSGSVTRADGSLAVNDIVYLRAPGLLALQSTVDTSGHYTFVDIPIGSYEVDSFDAATNSAASANIAVTSNATTVQNLALQSTGIVSGAVTANDGSTTSGLTVTLTSTTSVGTQTLTTTTATNGTFSFNNVQPGTIAIHVTNSEGLQGTANGSLPVAGQTITLNIALQASGTVTGTVFQGDGTTPAPGIQVTLSPGPISGSATTTTDSNGHYTFSNAQFGNFTVYALNTTNGDNGQSTGQVQVNGQLRTINVTLQGFGNLIVKVINTSSNPVPNAAITVTNQGTNTSTTGTADATGTATFNNLFVGDYAVTAKDPATGLGTSSSLNITYNTTQTLTLTVQSVGIVEGTVYAVDGVTPVAGATVQLSNGGGSIKSGSDGTFKFNNVATGTYYAATVYDSIGYLRAKVQPQYLQTNGQILTENLTYIGLGSVSGTVTNADGTRAENISLTIVSQNATIGATQNTQTGGDGTYSAVDIPAGKFTVTANLPSSLAGFGTSTITQDGDAEVVNIQIQSSTVTLPLTLTDADQFNYTINYNGDYTNTGQLAGASPFYDAQSLSLTVAGSSSTFGQGAPTTSIQSLSGQQVEISEPSVQGLNVTRKVYVPSTGYFGRRLDVLQNPTSAPITVTVAYNSYQHYTADSPRIVNTSNNNTTIDKTILWEVDDDSADFFPYPQTQPALADVFAGPGAPTGVANVTSNVYQGGRINYNYYSYQGFNYSYVPVTIPANGTASFLFFTAQEAISPTGTSAAQRLDQLPAEALAGLSTADLANVVNFVVPPSPLSAVTQPAAGSITGYVYAYDGTTIIPGATVYMQSTDLEYGFGTSAVADSTGLYTIPATVGLNYALTAVDPINNIHSQAVTGTIPATGTQTQNISYINTGIVQGVVKPTGQSTFTGGTVTLLYPCQPQTPGVYAGNCDAYATFGSNGLFTFLAIPPGNNSFNASVNTPQGSVISIPANGSYLAQVNAGQTTQFTFVMPATGNIAGQVLNADNSAAPGIKVYAIPSNYNVGVGGSTTTDNNGNFAFNTLPLDTYTIQATDPSTNDLVYKTTTLTQDATNTVNLQFLGKGTLVVTVKYFNGNPAPGAYETLATSTNANAGAGSTDSNGQITFTNVPTGAFTLTNQYPGINILNKTTGTMTGNGGTQQVTATLPPVGTVQGTLTNSDGSVAAGAYVYIIDAAHVYSAYAQTDSAGTFAFFPVPADRTVSLSSSGPGLGNHATTAQANNQQVPGDGQTLTVNLRYPGGANVHVSVVNADGTPVTFGAVYLASSDGTQKYQQNIGSDGTTTFTSVVEASYLATANPGSDFSLGSTQFVLSAANDNTTVQVTITATPMATVQGQVYAADGQTVIRDDYTVNIQDVLTGNNETAYPSGGTGYQFTNVQVGSSGYSITAELYDTPSTAQTVTGNITTQGQVITQNLTLPVSSISGTVYLFDGVTPAPNIQVFALQTLSNGSTNSFYTSTDANGTYQLSGPVTGAVTVQASDANGVIGKIALTLTSDTQIVTGQNISLEATGSVFGVAYDANGVALANAEIDLQSTANNSGFYESTYTDANGNFSFTDVAVGNITLTTYSTSPNETATGVLNNNGDSTTINLGNVPTSHIFGTVYDSSGNLATGATVTAMSLAQNGPTLTATSDDNGMYNIAGLPAGDVSVSAALTDGSTTASVTGTIVSLSTPVEIDLGLQNPGDVSGVIIDQNGNPVPNVTVVVMSSGSPGSSTFEGSNTDGSYDFGGISVGTITVQVLNSSNAVVGTATGNLPYGGNLVMNVTVMSPVSSKGPAPLLKHLSPDATRTVAGLGSAWHPPALPRFAVQTSSSLHSTSPNALFAAPVSLWVPADGSALPAALLGGGQ